MSVLRSAGLRSAVASAASSSRLSAASCPRTFASSSLRASKDPQLGDYPDVPMKSYQLRKHDKNYFDPQEKRNFGETPGEQDDILSVWAPDIHEHVRPSKALGQFCIAAAGFATFFATIYYFTPEAHFVRRVYPRDGLTEELSGPWKAPKEGDFDQKKDDGDEDGEDDE
ncbi:unnamed protein product [Parajaminaea phylloscopi]